jgi:hypothetical protein
MRKDQSKGALKQAKRAARGYQQTFSTPLQDLDRFVGTILSALPGVETGRAVIEQIVFEPRYRLPQLAKKHDLDADWVGQDLVIEAVGRDEVQELLCAMLSEWIDFCFIPAPGRYLIYADHDEFITFFADKEPQLDRLASALTRTGFKRVDYVRRF